MKRPLVVPLLLLTLAACDSGPKVVVRASLNGRPVADLPVRLLPYDREAILDSLQTALELPEPGSDADSTAQKQTSGADTAGVKAPPRPARGDSAKAAPAAPVASPEQVRRARADSLRAARAEWLAKITPRYDSAAERKRGEAGQVEKSDTTDAAGRAELAAGEGKWWLVASYVLPNQELEWYLPVTVRGDSIVVTLDRANAKVRSVSY